MRKALVVGVAVALALTACGDSEPAQPTEPLRDTQVIEGTVGPSFSDCDALPGAEVVVTDQAGTVIGTTVASEDTNGPGNGCLVEFSVEVPSAEFYTLRIGTHDGPTYSRAELDEANWAVELSLG